MACETTMLRAVYADQLTGAIGVCRRVLEADPMTTPDLLARCLRTLWYPGAVGSLDDMADIGGIGGVGGIGDIGSLDDMADIGDVGGGRSVAGADDDWRSCGSAWAPEMLCSGSPVICLYLAIEPERLAEATNAITDLTRSWEGAWSTRTARPSDLAPGPEASGLCFPASSLSRLHGQVADLVSALQPWLRDTSPALTLPVGRGSALAQNPPDGSGFGEHRCRIIASAVLAASVQSTSRQASRVASALAAAGVDPERPYRALAHGWWDEPWLRLAGSGGQVR